MHAVLYLHQNKIFPINFYYIPDETTFSNKGSFLFYPNHSFMMRFIVLFVP